MMNGSAGAAGVSAQGGAGSAQGGAAVGGGGAQSMGGGAAGGGAGNGGVPADECEGAPAPDAALLAKCSGSPLSCLFGGEPGHYDVRLELSVTADPFHVEAESRRVVVGEGAVPAGQARCLSMTVNVRSPEGQPIQDTAPEGTPGLNLRLVGGGTLQAVGVSKVLAPIVLYVAGDSTVCDQDPQLDVAPNARYTGWGQILPQYFRRDVSVTSYADSGESTQAFRVDGGSLWARISTGLKAGDYVFIQLGHNDKTTDAATYRSRITGMLQAVKAKNATPVLVTPIVRNNGSPLAEQHIYGNLNARSELLQIAITENATLIDLMSMTDAWVNELGRTTAQTYFVGTDATHTNELGAAVFARFMADAIAQSGLALKAYLR